MFHRTKRSWLACRAFIICESKLQRRPFLVSRAQKGRLTPINFTIIESRAAFSFSNNYGETVASIRRARSGRADEVVLQEEKLNFLDTFISENEDSVVVIDTTDPDDAVLLETERQLMDEILIDAEVLGDPADWKTPQGGDGPNYANM